MLNPGGVLIIEDVPNLHYRLQSIKSSIPKEEHKFLFGVGYVHLSGRFDDALIVYSSDPDFRRWFKRNTNWISRNVLLESYLIALFPPVRNFLRLMSMRKRRNSHQPK